VNLFGVLQHLDFVNQEKQRSIKEKQRSIKKKQDNLHQVASLKSALSV